MLIPCPTDYEYIVFYNVFSEMWQQSVYIYLSLHSNIHSRKQHELDATLACAIDTVLMNRSWIIGENLALWLLLTACDKVGYTLELSPRYMIHWSFVTLLNNTYNGHIDKHVLEAYKSVLVGHDMSLLILHYIIYFQMQIMIV